MKTTKKLVLCIGLLTFLCGPLAGCSDTWQGVKNDWHSMTSSSDDSSAAPQQEQSAQQMPAQQDDDGAAKPAKTYNN